MIDDDHTPDEGDVMPAAWWRVAEAIPLTVRYRASRIPGLPPLAFGDEFYGCSLSVHGPCYLDLSQFTRYNARGHTTPRQRAFDALTAAFPEVQHRHRHTRTGRGVARTTADPADRPDRRRAAGRARTHPRRPRREPRLRLTTQTGRAGAPAAKPTSTIPPARIARYATSTAAPTPRVEQTGTGRATIDGHRGHDGGASSQVTSPRSLESCGKRSLHGIPHGPHQPRGSGAAAPVATLGRTHHGLNTVRPGQPSP